MPEFPMLVFDGECGFCNRAVQFILVHERRSDLHFVPRESALGDSLRRKYHLENVESLLWIEDGRAFVEFEAVAHTAAYVGSIYSLLASTAELLLPCSLLNASYRAFAKFRKRLAHRSGQCLLLTASQQQRFLS